MSDWWTGSDIDAIMLQLDNKRLPFKNYRLKLKDGKPILLGQGGTAYVFSAESANSEPAVIKVTGFGDKQPAQDTFQRAVEAQMKVSDFSESIVKIYEDASLHIKIKGDHEVVSVEKAEAGDEDAEENTLCLHFAVMDKLTPIISSDRTVIDRLRVYNEDEILKLANDIGNAICEAHKCNLIHRDIKPENIFYDSRVNTYKLGDFGMVKAAVNGFAGTRVYTIGYGAPEVVVDKNQYDCTADIYSFGMTLYFLMNKMRLPESKDVQYKSGYVPPEPVNGSADLKSIVMKMISYSPDDRYQSMKDALVDLDAVNMGNVYKYRGNLRGVVATMGFISALAGAFTWKLSFRPDIRLVFSPVEYLLIALCLGKTWFYLKRKSYSTFSVLILGLGIYVLFSAGFAWWKLILLLLAVFTKRLPGVLGSMALAANIGSIILEAGNFSVDKFSGIRWMTALYITLALMLFLYYAASYDKERYAERNRKMVFPTIILFYLTLIIVSFSFSHFTGGFEALLGTKFVRWVLSWDSYMVGICGVAFWIAFFLEERIYYLSSS